MSPPAPKGPQTGMFSAMPRAGRYRMDACLFEIAKMRDRLDLQDKDIFMSIHMGQANFSRKMSGARRFTVEELGLIADFFAEKTGRALPGWPILSDGECKMIESHVYGSEPAAHRR